MKYQQICEINLLRTFTYGVIIFCSKSFISERQYIIKLRMFSNSFTKIMEFLNKTTLFLGYNYVVNKSGFFYNLDVI